MPIQEKCRVLDHQQIAPRYFQLTLASAYISSNAKPGQFVQVRCSEEYDPLLRRPFSIHRISKKTKRFSLLYEVVGKGTELLSQAKVGAELDLLGPLGNGFSIDKSKSRLAGSRKTLSSSNKEAGQTAILVGGGMGVAPLVSLAEQITNDKFQMTNSLHVLIGAKNKKQVLCEKTFREITDKVLVCTDDGSLGQKSLVSDILLEKLSVVSCQSLVIYACGPKAMLKAVADIAAQKKIACQVSMEARMACGIGTCLGCVIKTKDGYKKVCNDGPVFNSKEIIWQS